MPDPSLQDLGDKLDDLARLLVRQGATLGGLADAASGTGPDLTLLVEWDTVEAHTVGFRKSAAFTRWRELIGPYFDGLPRVEHFHDLG